MNRIQREKEKLEFLHEHIGIVKDRLEFQLTLISTYTSNTEHGLKDTYYFTDSKNAESSGNAGELHLKGNEKGKHTP